MTFYLQCTSASLTTERSWAPATQKRHAIFPKSIKAFCLRMLSSGSFNLKNRWYAPAPRVRRDRNETMAIFARNPLRITVVFLLFALYDLGESVEKSKFGCLLCERKSQLRPFQKAKAYTNDLESCFGIRAAIDDDKLIICEVCRRALKEHRRTGKSFHHVSAVSSHL